MRTRCVRCDRQVGHVSVALLHLYRQCVKDGEVLAGGTNEGVTTGHRQEGTKTGMLSVDGPVLINGRIDRPPTRYCQGIFFLYLLR